MSDCLRYKLPGSYRWTLLVGITMVAIALTVWTGFAEESLRLRTSMASQLPQHLTAPQAYLLGLMNAQMSYMNDTWSRINTTLYIATQERPGYRLAKQGAKANYPIVMIPGFVTSSLELWDGLPCAKRFFRQRFWGGVGTKVRSFFTDRRCWLQHMELDVKTGLDPEGIKLRATDSFDGADYFMSGYWVWNKLIQNFADVGYDASTMTMETYDWRLSFPMLEKRDGYMTRLKLKIEAIHKTSGKKVALVSHSMGSQLLHYFFAWVTTSERKGGGGGGGGKRWVDDHVQVFVNIAGPMLGTAKAVPSLLSGEFKDTAYLNNAFGGAMIEQLWGRVHRKRMWGSWGSLWTLLPMGGDLVWGDESFVELTDAPTAQVTDHKESCEAANPVTDADAADETVQHKLIQDFSKSQHHTLESTLRLLSRLGKERGIASARTLSLDPSDTRLHSGNWHDPTRTPLPYAPNMKIFCFYGHGIDTERNFKYKRNVETPFSSVSGGDPDSCSSLPSNDELPFIMDSGMEDLEQNIQYGAKLEDGDASVSLVSLGYVCADGWRRDDMNPSKIPVVTREFRHQQEFVVDDPIRSGPLSADHVDILGNADMTEDLLRVVTDFESSQIQDKFTSNILDIVEAVKERRAGREAAKAGTTAQFLREAFSPLLASM